MTLARTTLGALVLALSCSTPLLAAPGGFLGVYLTEESAGDDGALIEDVAPDSPAAQAGLRKGDRILKCNGKATPHATALIKHLVAANPGDTLKLRASRDGWQKTLKVTLGGTKAPAPQAESQAPQERGFLGIYLRQGAQGEPIVDGVAEGSAAAKAGLKVGDQVLAVGGTQVSDSSSLIARMSQYGPGATVEMSVKRGNKEMTLSPTLGRRPAERTPPRAEAQPTQPKPAPAPESKRPAYIGIALVDADGKGPLKVDDVQANGPAERFGVRAGDVLVEVNGKGVKTIEDFVKAMDGLYAGDAVKLKIERDGWRSEVRVTLGARPK